MEKWFSNWVIFFIGKKIFLNKNFYGFQLIYVKIYLRNATIVFLRFFLLN